MNYVDTIFKSIKNTNFFFDSFPAMVWISDTGASMVYFNRAWLEFSGRAIVEEYGFGWQEGVHPKDIDNCIAEYISAFNSRAFYQSEFRLRRRNQEYRWVRNTGWPCNSPEGDFTGYIGFCQDITEQKIRDIISIDRESYYRALIENISDIITIVTENKTVIFSSASTKKILGYESEELIGKIYSNYIESNDTEIFDKAFIAAVSQPPSPVSLIYKFLNKDGNYCYLESVLKNINAENTVTGIIINSRDITQRVKMQNDLRHATEMAETANFAKSLFIANVSHEIRTPLNSISGFAELLTASKLSHKQKKYADYIKTGCDVLTSLVNNVLDFSKIEAQKMEIEESTFTLAGLVKDITILTTKASTVNNTTVKIFIKESPDKLLKGDYKKLRQIILNLVSNAIKFTHDGKVNLIISRHEEKNEKLFLKFNVNNTGIGISPEHIDKIFQPFSQARPGQNWNYGGTGLGLYISNKLVEFLGGGHIHVKSSPGEGSDFCFTLPFQPLKSSEIIHRPASQIIEHSKNNKTLNILIAEDNTINRLLIEELLKKMGHNTYCAFNGKQAIEMVASASYDIIFMDIQMPVLDGYDAARQIRKTNPDIPIVAMTANAIKGDYEKCIEAGMNDYLSKPLDFEKFNEALKKNVRFFSNENSTLEKKYHENNIKNEQNKQIVFDREKFKKNTFSNPEIAKKIIYIFFDDLKKCKSYLDNAIKEKNGELLSRTAHRLKGSALNICAYDLKLILYELETSGRENRFDEAENLIIEFENKIEELKKELEKSGY